MLDRQQHRFMDASVTTTSGTVMFEDKETQSPTQYSQRFNVGLNGLWDSFSTLLDGDANLDQAVNVGDLGVLAARWGQSQANWLEADFNGDGTVNVGDLGMLAAHWGQTIPTVMVPEPASAILLGFGLLGVLTGRARRRSRR